MKAVLVFELVLGAAVHARRPPPRCRRVRELPLRPSPPPRVCHAQLVKKTQPAYVFIVCPVQFCSLINDDNVRNQDVEQGQ